MNRVLVVGQPGDKGPLSFSTFAESLSRRMGVPRLSHRCDHAATHPDWIAAEPAGLFSEPLFRRADTVVWLHFSPLPYVQDWLGRSGDALRSALTGRSGLVARAGWLDVVGAFRTLMMAPEMYSLFGHPALAHVRLVELRSPRQAQFWLMTQRRRRPGDPPRREQQPASPRDA